MDACTRTWLLIALLFVTSCLTASQKIDKGMAASVNQENGMAGPEDQEIGLAGPEYQEEDSQEEGYGSGQSTCSNDTCNENGRCVIETNGNKSVAVCKCDQGVVGRWCDDISKKTYTTYCSSNPCQNGGTCNVNDFGFFCSCYDGYSGKRCEKIGCTRGSCGYGVCLPSSVCDCHPGWMGDRCNINPCTPNPCFNHAACSVQGNGFSCDCAPQHDGLRCERQRFMPVNRCLPFNPCQNGGTCNEAGSPICDCHGEHTGPFCQIPTITPCSPNPCNNYGVCKVEGRSFECQCPTGYGGVTCSKRLVDHCNPNPCQNGGVCNLSTTHYVCDCPRFTQGVNCQIHPCQPNPCLHGGTCAFFGTDPVCTCDNGYYGPRCEFRYVTNPCPSNTCNNQGLCYNNRGVVHCQCFSGYTGPFCNFPSQQPDPCSSNPCQNGGTCQSYQNSRLYTCACLSGTTGVYCQAIETNQDSPCNPNPCKGGCKCVQSCRHANGYFCTGTNGLLGKNCQIPAPVIICGANIISISIDAEIVNEYDSGFGEFRMFMARSHSMILEHSCPAQDLGNSYSLVLPLPFNNCGSKVVTNDDGKIIVSNYIWLNRWIANGVGDMPVPILHFTCEYETQYSVISSLNPGVDNPPIISFRGPKTSVSAQIDLCKSGDFCPSQCPEMYSLSQGATYTVGEELFLRIMPPRRGTQFRISDLFLSCSSDPATTYATSPIVFLTNGCLASGTGKYLPTNVRPTATGICASFPVPLLKSCGKFYIHAKLQLCAPGFCVSAYSTCSGRRKRSATSGESDEKPRIQVFGPIVVIKGEEGVATKVMYPGEEYVNSTNTGVLIFKDEAVPTITGSSILLPFYVSLGVLLLVAVTLFGLLVCHNWHKINAHCGRRV